ncbi:polyprenyl glycosylphosphotransferase [Corynebacterium pelargi]|uniref:Putative sugar transferase EpsL n=1 Tax=Corynebacterium pelargi TaxID=1471400 RepID=A0A410W5S4_9CORY|nr:putative sugar transferase EpsL [Corynebacterium pelargi]GGG81250.1 polyprenyl glycosylphosphotransferase [Corynebacterium pelargi]
MKLRRKQLRTFVRLFDALSVTIAVTVGNLARFGTDPSFAVAGNTKLSYLVITPVIIIIWLITLRVLHTSDERILGIGPDEYSKVFNATFIVFGVVAIISVLTETDLSRGYLAVSFSLGLILLLANHWFWRHKLLKEYREGRCRRRVIVVGGKATSDVLPLLGHGAGTPWSIVGICKTENVPLALSEEISPDVPVVNSWKEVCQLVEATGADTVAIYETQSLGHTGMRELTWELEATEVDLLVSPGLIDVSGPRMHMRPAAGVPLIHIDKPRYEGANRISKVLLDRIGAFLLIILFSPVLLLCALVVKLTSRGPVFYVSERIGLQNEPFGMIKFRTMVPGADRMKEQLSSQNESEGGVLFKMREDPRVTKVGRFLRRFSLDELPQLFNVLGGTMSLVGPRPPLREEVVRYDSMVARRMLVKPGMTGLWQVSGRSNLSWEQSVRLDLSYVENWSLLGDLYILWNTARAVISKEGAY